MGHFHTTQQVRSEAAMQAVKRFKDTHTEPGDRESYRSRARELPGMVRTNNLLQTMVFFYSKSGDQGYVCIAEDIRKWLEKAITQGYLAGERQSVRDFSSLIEWLTRREVGEYMAITEEILNFSGWVKRFAEGMLEPTTGG